MIAIMGFGNENMALRNRLQMRERKGFITDLAHPPEEVAREAIDMHYDIRPLRTQELR